MENTNITTIVTKTVNKPSFIEIAFNLTWRYAFGVFMIVTGFMLTLTIIGAVIGIPGMIFGVTALGFAPLEVKVTCDACGNSNKVGMNSKNMACKYCGTITPLRWK